jgi:hypothetical protein
MRILPGHSGKPLFSPGDLLSFMGNLFGLPQSILCFAMFDIFWYAVYQSHLMPMWLFVVIVLVLAGLIPLILAILALSKRKRAA